MDTKLKKGIITEAAVPVRALSADSAEMTNQLLFGESYQVIEEKEKWIKISSNHDNYVGWIDKKQHTEIAQHPMETAICYEEAFIQHAKRGRVRMMPGALVPDNKCLEELGFELLEHQVKEGEELRAHAMKFMNAPYLWGGRTPLGIDCSGFTQLVYRMMGMNILRDASQQVEEGSLVSFLDEAKEGDLAFFDNAEGRITHVGILLEEQNTKKIIHASGRVRIDKIDHNGIYNEDTQSYSHKLRTIKTLI